MYSALFAWEDLRPNQCHMKSCLYLHRSCSRTVRPCETIACPLPLSPHLTMAKAWESWSCLATGLEQHECRMPGCRRSVCLVALCPLLIPLPSNCSLPPLTFSRSWIAMGHTCTLLWEALRSRTCPFGEGRSSKRDKSGLKARLLSHPPPLNRAAKLVADVNLLLALVSGELWQNPRITEWLRWEGTSGDYPVLFKQVHLEQVAQKHIQLVFNYLKRRRLHNLSAQPVPVLSRRSQGQGENE